MNKQGTVSCGNLDRMAVVMVEQTPDGSPVSAYAHLPAEPDLTTVRQHSAGRSTVLDLGCGTGRIADPLTQDGHPVVAVDESAAMLAHVRHATPVQASVQDLHLHQRFDLVLLLSHLINSTAASAFLDTAHRHLKPDGLLLIQRLLPHHQWRAGPTRLGEVTVTLLDVQQHGSSVRATTRYDFSGRQWSQHWTAYLHTDDELAALLSTADLQLVALNGAWVTAAVADHPLSGTRDR